MSDELSFPLSEATIHSFMQSVITTISSKTDLEPNRSISDISISLGEAPEFGFTFGVHRFEKNLIFGTWLNDIKPDYQRQDLSEFILIRETFLLFFSWELYSETLEDFLKLAANLFTYCFLLSKYSEKPLSVKYSAAQSRFLYFGEKPTLSERQFTHRIGSLLTTIKTRKVSYIRFLKTIQQFIEGLNINDLNSDELLSYLFRYFSVSPLVIAAPFNLRPRTLAILDQIIENGFQTTNEHIASSLNINQSTVSRSLQKISAKYNARFKMEINPNKIGLYPHVLLIGFPSQKRDCFGIIRKNKVETQASREKNNHAAVNKEQAKNIQNSFQFIYDYLLSIPYISEIYFGKSNNKCYIYSKFHCPFIVAERLNSNLKKYLDDKLFEDFSLNEIKVRQFRIAVIHKDFDTNLDFYKKLLEGKIDCEKRISWSSSKLFVSSEKYCFSTKDQDLLTFLSFYRSCRLHNNSLHGVFYPKAKAFLAEKGYSQKKMPDLLSYMNQLRSDLIEKKLIDMRLVILPSGIANQQLLSFKINSNEPFSKKFSAFLDSWNYFSWSVVQKTIEGAYINILGVPYDHPLTKSIISHIEKWNYNDFQVSSMINQTYRPIPFEELYDIQSKLWKII
jgi:DNA-binding Lrp family transcriptional regulator